MRRRSPKGTPSRTRSSTRLTRPALAGCALTPTTCMYAEQLRSGTRPAGPSSRAAASLHRATRSTSRAPTIRPVAAPRLRCLWNAYDHAVRHDHRRLWCPFRSAAFRSPSTASEFRRHHPGTGTFTDPTSPPLRFRSGLAVHDHLRLLRRDRGRRQLQLHDRRDVQLDQ